MVSVVAVVEVPPSHESASSMVPPSVLALASSFTAMPVISFVPEMLHAESVVVLGSTLGV